MDLATLFGLLAGLGLIGTAIVLGGSPTAFIDLPSVLIVLGGTFAVTTVSYSVPEILRSQAVLVHAIFLRRAAPGGVAVKILELADMARKTGVLGMQETVRALDAPTFFKNGLSLVVDGTPGDEVERVMRQEIRGMLSRHEKTIGILQRAATIAPAMGLIGTLVGLVQMLGQLNDPASIGPSMAVALLTTLYGAMLSNMVFTPLAGKLERNSREEALLMTLYTIGAGSIGRQENPRRLEILLNALLPPAQRAQYFD
jgi:chemotaxis protein MotA